MRTQIYREHMYQQIQENQQKNYTFIFDHNTESKDITLYFDVQTHAMLMVHLVIIDTSVRVKIQCILQGEGAHAKIYGAYAVSGTHAVAIDTIQHHQAAYTSSTLVMKGVVRDSAQAQYQGMIRIEKEAYEVNASQENKNIVLSDAARVISVPNLQVLNNEVRCFHGSAVGGFDQEQILYAACRGIDEKKAERMLLAAFFADVVEGSEKMCLLLDYNLMSSYPSTSSGRTG